MIKHDIASVVTFGEARLRILSSAIVVSLVIGPALRADPQEEGSMQQRAAPSWWFPSEVSIGKEYRFHLVLDASRTDSGNTVRLQDEVDFTLTVRRPEEGAPGCIVRCKLRTHEKKPSAPIAAWLTSLTRALRP